MNRKTRSILESAAKSIQRLIDECRKNGTLYVKNPAVVAHVSRTSKWLLNALSKLRGVFTEGKENE